VGYRSRDGQLLRLEEYKTQDIPKWVKHVGQNRWDGNLCINFAAAFLKCEYLPKRGLSVLELLQPYGSIQKFLFSLNSSPSILTLMISQT